MKIKAEHTKCIRWITVTFITAIWVIAFITVDTYARGTKRAIQNISARRKQRISEPTQDISKPIQPSHIPARPIEPPQLVILSIDHMKVYQNEFTLVGATEPDSDIYVRDVTPAAGEYNHMGSANSQGRFFLALDLEEGENSFEIYAENGTRMSEEKMFHITYEPREDNRMAWEPIGFGGGGHGYCIEVDPTDDSIIYMGSDVGGLYKSKDGGRTWLNKNKGVIENFPQGGTIPIFDVAVNPSNNNELFLAEKCVLKSEDQGETWELFDSFWHGREIEYAPDDGNIVYLAVRTKPEYDRFRHDMLLRIYNNASGTHTDITEPMLSFPTDPAIIPDELKWGTLDLACLSGGRVYIATHYGVYASNNYGQDWVDITDYGEGLRHRFVDSIDANLDPETEKVTLTAKLRAYEIELLDEQGEPYDTIEEQGGLYRMVISPTGGTGWEEIGLDNTQLQNGLNYNLSNRDAELTRGRIAIAPDDPNHMIVNCGSYNYMFVTHDEGEDWDSKPTVFSWGMLENTDENAVAKLGSQPGRGWGNYPTEFCFSQTTPGIVWSSNHGVNAVSYDYGDTWYGMESKLVQSGGEVLWDYEWSSRGNNRTYTEVIKFSPHAPSLGETRILWLGDNDNDLWKSAKDKGYTWSIRDIWIAAERRVRSFIRDNYPNYPDFHPRVSVGAIAFDPNNPEVMYAVHGTSYPKVPLNPSENAGYIVKSTDGGETWDVVGHPDAGLPFGSMRGEVIAIDPNVVDLETGESTTIYVSNYGRGVYKSTDGGLSWANTAQPRDPLHESNEPLVTWLQMDPNDSQHLYVGLRKEPESNGGGIYETFDGGENWYALIENLDVVCLAINPENPQIIYAAANGPEPLGYGTVEGIYRSQDGGLNWTKVLAYPRVFCIEVNPVYPDIIYVGTLSAIVNDHLYIGGLYRTLDGGETWDHFEVNEDLRTKFHRILDIEIDPDDPAMVYIGTQGAGTFKAKDYAAEQLISNRSPRFNLDVKEFIQSKRFHPGKEIRFIVVAEDPDMAETGEFRSGDLDRDGDVDIDDYAEFQDSFYGAGRSTWNIYADLDGDLDCDLKDYAIFAQNYTGERTSTETLTYRAENLPDGANFDSEQRYFSWAPGYNQVGVLGVTFVVEDSTGHEDRMDINIRITPAYRSMRSWPRPRRR